MNERIRDLWTKVCQSEMPELNESCMTMQRQRKFAELIQKDMIQNCRDMFIKDSVSWNLLTEKLEHFGVKE